MKSDWGVLYTVEKIFLRATRYFIHIFKILILGQQKSQFWDSHLRVSKKMTFDVIPVNKHRIYYRDGNGASSQRLWAM
jgi:hypothetical protein